MENISNMLNFAQGESDHCTGCKKDVLHNHLLSSKGLNFSYIVVVQRSDWFTVKKEKNLNIIQ